MAYRLYSTLRPQGDLYSNHQDARIAMGRMVKSLEQKGFNHVEYAVQSNREGAMMRHEISDETIEVHISVE